MSSVLADGRRPPKGPRRLVPAALAGPGRRAAWRRLQLRRAVSALLVGVAGWMVAAAVVPHPAPVGVAVVVAARDLPAGQVLLAGDVRTVLWQDSTAPSSAVTEPTVVVGRRLSGPVVAGEALTDARLQGRGLLTGMPAGTVAVHIPLADPATAAITQAGARVDVLSTRTGAVVAPSIRVLSVDTIAASDASWVGSGASAEGGVVVAVLPEIAGRLAAALGNGDGAGLTLAVHADDR